MDVHIGVTGDLANKQLCIAGQGTAAAFCMIEASTVTSIMVPCSEHRIISQPH